jgi:ornithine--oxo-acid transaminase
MSSFDAGATHPPNRSVAEHIGLSQKHSVANGTDSVVLMARGRGSWVQDPKGKRYLDMLSRGTALNLGHRHPRILSALKAQADRITLTSGAFYNDQEGPLLARLADLTGFGAVLLTCTTAEAVDFGFQACRNWAARHKGVSPELVEIITTDSRVQGPGLVGVPPNDVDALAAAIGPNTAAFFLAPFQVDGGLVLPADDYLRRVRTLCDESEIQLFVDESQTGLGRTGKRFAYEHGGVRPDCLVLGPGLGGGVYPVNAFLGDRALMDGVVLSDRDTAFWGNPLASAVALASLDVLVEEDLAGRASRLGERFLAGLCALDSPHVVQARGIGLLIELEIRSSSGPAQAFCGALLQRGLLCESGPKQVIRFAPALTIDIDDLDWAVSVIAEVLA